MGNKIIIDALHDFDRQIAVVDSNGQLLKLYFDDFIESQTIGNIYIGIIVSIEPALQAAFVKYTDTESGFLPLSEVNVKHFNKSINDDELSIEKVLKLHQRILVQVIKEPRGHKGASLSTYIGLDGYIITYHPNGMSSPSSVYNKMNDADQKKKLELLFSKLCDNGQISSKYIIDEYDEEIISCDYNELVSIWNKILNDYSNYSVPTKLYDERDLFKLIIREWLSRDIYSIVISGVKAFNTIKKILYNIACHNRIKIFRYNGASSIFDKYNISNQLENLYNDTIALPSGGYIVINHTEALIAIDVNSGKSKDTNASIDEMAYMVNIEASFEVYRQIELRELSGLIIVDFIDMASSRYRRMIEIMMIDYFRNSNVIVHINAITPFGIMGISRQRKKKSLLELTTVKCHKCHGNGFVASYSVVIKKLFRDLYSLFENTTAILHLEKDFMAYILNNHYDTIKGIKKRLRLNISFNINDSIESLYILENIRATHPSVNNISASKINNTPPSRCNEEEVTRRKPYNKEEKVFGKRSYEERTIEGGSSRKVAIKEKIEVIKDQGDTINQEEIAEKKTFERMSKNRDGRNSESRKNKQYNSLRWMDDWVNIYLLKQQA
ncbi:MAG: Rne/Rng family ribonuclease [Anaplasmataceae bacterium]|nr:Rne/Rng family ribonuclease [Anaplasmataceae bacterium]